MRATLRLSALQPTRRLMVQPTRRLLSPIPKEEQAAHTVSQRLRRLKSIPAELYPLGVVVSFALLAATYSSVRKFIVDPNLRLKRQGPGKAGTGEDESDGHEH